MMSKWLFYLYCILWKQFKSHIDSLVLFRINCNVDPLFLFVARYSFIHLFIYLYSIDHTDVEFVIKYKYKYKQWKQYADVLASVLISVKQ